MVQVIDKAVQVTAAIGIVGVVTAIVIHIATTI
jgi:hypothetical protein